MKRVQALVAKEFRELRQYPSIFMPAALTGVLSILLPFFIAIVVPAMTGERLSDSSDFAVALEVYRNQPWLRGINPEGAIQAWIFQQFLVLLVLAPIAGSMSVAAHSIIGEKQARTLEPLLATPLTTLEILGAKILAALLPALVLTAASFAIALTGIGVFAQPGVWRALLTPASIGTLFVLGPLATLVALQLAVCVSSRVNDVRSAQQIGALVILPVAAVLVLQITGLFQLTLPRIALIATTLAAVNGGLALLGIALFDRESILTRWK